MADNEPLSDFGQSLSAALDAAEPATSPLPETPVESSPLPTTPTATETAQPTSAAPETQVSQSGTTPTEPVQLDPWVEKLKGMGVDVSAQYKNGDDILKAFVHQRELIGRQSQYVQLGKQLEQNPREIIDRYAPGFGYVPAAQFQQQQQPAPPAQPQQVTRETLAELQNAVVRDEQGTITGVKPGCDPQAAYRLRDFEQRAIQTQQEFLLNPDKFILDRLKPVQDQIQQQTREQIARDMQQHQTVAQEQAEAVGFFEQNKHWLIDPATNSLSQNGQVFNAFMNEGMKMGIAPNNTQGLVTYALRGLQAMAAQQQRQINPPPTPAKPAAISKPGVNTMPPTRDEGEYNEGETFLQALNRNLAMAGPE